MSDEIVKQGRDWDEMRRMAETRPAMYIGEQSSAHRHYIRDSLRLIWKAKVFRRPTSVIVDLSPTQYIVRAQTGPLIRPIQKIFTFGQGQTLSETWEDEYRSYSRTMDDDEASQRRGNEFQLRRRSHGWRYCFGGPRGPRLASPSYQSILARQLTWGLRTEEGLWCEAYQNGKPTARPFLVQGTSPVGLFIASELDPQWLMGLPYTENDINYCNDLSYSRQDFEKSPWRSRPSWTAGLVTAQWHPSDNLVTERLLTPEGVQEWL